MNPASTEFLSTLLNFSVVVFILWHFGRKPIAEGFQARSLAIGSSVQEARTLSEGAKADLAHWKSKADAAQAEINAQVKDAQASMAKFKETTLARVNMETKRISEEAATVIAAESAKAKRVLRRQIVEESLEQARLYLGQNVEAKDSQKLLTDYLEGVADGHVG